MADWCENLIVGARHAIYFVFVFGDESLMRRRGGEGRGGRAADRGSAVKPEARQGLPSCRLGACRGLYLLGRAVRFLGRKERRGTAWAVPRRSGQWHWHWHWHWRAARLPVSVLRVEQRVGVSPSRSCFADTHTAHGMARQALS